MVHNYFGKDLSKLDQIYAYTAMDGDGGRVLPERTPHSGTNDFFHRSQCCWSCRPERFRMTPISFSSTVA
jgi:hypothetical protein